MSGNKENEYFEKARDVSRLWRAHVIRNLRVA